MRASPGSEGRAAFGALPSPTPGLVFARRKRTAFKGPMLTIGAGLSSYGSGRVGSGSAATGGPSAGAGAGSRSVSVQGRQSGEIIEEEDEDEADEGDEEEEDVEIVDAFSPITGNDEVVEIFGEHVDNKEEAKAKAVGKEDG